MGKFQALSRVQTVAMAKFLNQRNTLAAIDRFLRTAGRNRIRGFRGRFDKGERFALTVFERTDNR